MRKIFTLCMIGILLFANYNKAIAQCLTATNGLFPAATFTPSCTGLAENITTLGYASEYSNIALTNGVTYIFRSSIATDYVTISNATGTTALSFGTTPVTYTATSSATFRFYTHTNSACGAQSSNRTRSVQCTAAPPANDNCSGAITITSGTTCVTTSGTTAGATQQLAATNCSGTTSSSANEVWYKFIADGVSAYTISATTGTISDLAIGLYSGSCPTPTFISCIDAITTGTETLSAGTLAAGTYYYRIYGYNGSSGTFTTCVTYISPCSGTPSGSIATSYFSNVSSQTARTNFTNTTTYTSPGYGDFYTSKFCSALSGDIIQFNFTLVGGTLGVAVYVDWNNDGSFSQAERMLTTNGYLPTGAYRFGLTVPASASVGDHRMRFICDFNSPNPAACSFATGGRGEAEDYKITILSSWSCSTAATTTGNPGNFNITQLKFVGTLSDPPANNSGIGLVNGYSNYTGLTKAIQEQGEAINIVSTVNSRSDLAAWVDWNNDGIFTTPGELVYHSPNIIFQSTTFGFQIPLATPPGNYKIRIRSYNWSDDVNAPYATIYPCGDYYNGETEDYLFTVVARCNARIDSVLNDVECSPTGTNTNFILTAYGTPGTTGFKWYNAASSGSSISTSSASGNPPAGTFATSVNTTTTYWVTATNASCETPVRVPVIADMRPKPSITFAGGKFVQICNGDNLSVSGTSSTETAYLIKEGFEGGGLGVFTNSTSVTPVNAYQNWTNHTSIYTPSGSSVFWQPSISSGFGSDKFVVAYSLAPGNSSNYQAYLTTTGDYNTTSFTGLKLDFNVYYDHYLADNVTTYIDSLSVQVSTNSGTSWTTIQKSAADIGKPSSFQTVSYDLLSYINKTNLKIRFVFSGELDASLGVAIDSVRLYGDRPASNSYIWTQVGGYIDPQYSSLYTVNLPADTTGKAYTGGNIANLYLIPTDAQGDDGTPLKFETRLDLSNGCTLKDTITVDVNDKIWTAGFGNKDWGQKLNWCGNKVPAPTDRVRVPNLGPGANYPIIPLGFAARTKFLTIDAGASATIDSGASLQIRGDLVTSLGGFFTNNGTLEMFGVDNGVAQNFPGAGTIAEMDTLIINNSKTPENGSNVVLNASISVRGALKPTAGILALGNNDITIKSKAAGDGYVSAVGSTAGFTYGTGRFVIERYIPARRAWRFLSIPVNSAQTINAAWQEGNVNPDKNCLNNATLPLGYGTEITYYTNGGSGFDPNITSNPSIKYWDSSANNWIAPTSTYVPINSRAAYCLFVRGDRTICLDGINPAKSTVLRIRGLLNQGTKVQSFGTIATGNHIMVGNPYPSPVDFNKIKAALNGVNPNYFYVWDPKIGGTYGVGKYVTYSTAGNTWTNNSGSYPSGTLPVFQSGQAFFVDANGTTGGSVTFSENAKTNTEFSVNRLKPNPVLHAQVLLPNDSLKVADAVCIVFGDRYADGADEFDAPKFWNGEGENMALVRNEHTFSIETRPKPKSTDTAFFRLYLVQGQPYALNIFMENIAETITGRCWLKDKYLNTETEVNLFGSTLYNFMTVKDDTMSYRNRFMLVYNREDTIAASKANSSSVSGVLGISVFPNPVIKHTFNLQLNNLKTGRYEVLLYDEKGGLVLNKTIEHAGKNISYKITVPATIASGIYTIGISGNEKIVYTEKLVIGN